MASASAFAKAAPWLAVLLALMLLLVFAPLAIPAAAAAALSSHGRDLDGPRNAAIAILVLAILVSVLFVIFGLGAADGGLIDQPG